MEVVLRGDDTTRGNAVYAAYYYTFRHIKNTLLRILIIIYHDIIMHSGVSGCTIDQTSCASLLRSGNAMLIGARAEVRSKPEVPGAAMRCRWRCVRQRVCEMCVLRFSNANRQHAARRTVNDEMCVRGDACACLMPAEIVRGGRTVCKKPQLECS